MKELTPVEEYNGIFYKRDDLYAPYEDFITGGKIRQCRDLVENNLDYIHDKCNSTIATAASIHSPQSPIVSRVATEFGLKSIIGFGNTTEEKALKHLMMRKCKEFGSEFVTLCDSQAYNSVLYSRLHELSETKPMFKILFGYAAQKHRDSIITRIAEQVENVDCDVLYVPVGSGVTLSGILEGGKMFQKQFKIIALQPFGYDRRKSIHSLLEGMSWDYEYDWRMGKYPYHQLFKLNVGFDLDFVYESKSYDMIKFNKDEKSCFWCIGNSNLFR